MRRGARGILLKPMPANPTDDQQLENRIAAVLELYGATTAKELLLAMLAERFPAFRTTPSKPPTDPIEAIIDAACPATRPAGRRQAFVGMELTLAEQRRLQFKSRNPRLSEIEICRRILRHDEYFARYARGSAETLNRLLREQRRKLRRKYFATKS